MSRNHANTQYDACDIVADWLDNKNTDIGWREVQRNHDRQIGKFVAGYEIHNLLISIAAWTHASCLDIDVLDKRTGAITMHCVGPCEQQEDLLDRLNRLQKRIKDCDLR